MGDGDDPRNRSFSESGRIEETDSRPFQKESVELLTGEASKGEESPVKPIFCKVEASAMSQMNASDMTDCYLGRLIEARRVPPDAHRTDLGERPVATHFGR